MYVRLSINLHACLSIRMYVFCLSVCMFVVLSLFVCPLSVCMYVLCLSVCMFVYSYECPFCINIHADRQRTNTTMFVLCLSVCLSVLCLFVLCLSMCVFACPLCVCILVCLY